MIERVLFYGSRTWTDVPMIRSAVADVYDADSDAVVIHGGATGADEIAGQAAEYLGLRVEVYRASWQAHGKAAGPIRNQQMIDQGKPTRAIGFRVEGESRGTDDMTRRLEAAGIPYVVRGPRSPE